jgi:hypothetical protein
VKLVPQEGFEPPTPSLRMTAIGVSTINDSTILSAEKCPISLAFRPMCPRLSLNRSQRVTALLCYPGGRFCYPRGNHEQTDTDRR